MLAIYLTLILFLTNKVIGNAYIKEPQLEVDLHAQYVNGIRDSIWASVSSPKIPGGSLSFDKPRGSPGQIMFNYQIDL